MPDDFETKPLSDNLAAGTNPPVSEPFIQHHEAGGFMGKVKDFYAANKLYVWAIVLGLAIIGILAFIAFRKPATPAPSEANVSVSINAQEAVPSGGEAVYNVNIENKDSHKLTGLVLEVAYPDGMTYVSSSPKAQNLSGTRFDIPDLISGQRVAVIVKTKVTGNVNEEKEIKTRLSYKIDGFSLDFVKEQGKTIRLSASDIALELEGPQTTSNAQLVSYTLKYKNNAKDTVKNGRIRFEYPQGFTYAASQPEPDQGNNTWNIEQLGKDAEGSLSVQGSYSAAQPGESKTMRAVFCVIAADGECKEQGSVTAVTQLSNLPLLVSQTLDGDKDGVVQAGDSLRFTVRFQNNSTVVARGVNIVATLDGKALDLSSIRSEGGIVSGNAITWNAASVSKLEQLSPDESGEVTFSVNVKNPPTRDSSKNLQISSSLKIKSDEHDTYLPGNQVQLKVASESSVSRLLRFTSGSLPPQVGRPSVYTVRLVLKNTTNEINEATVTAFVPLGAGGFDTSSVSSGEASRVQYDPSTGKLTWNVGVIPAHTGSFAAARQLEFSVRLQPSASQVGDAPVLVRDIRLSGTDAFTSQKIESVVDEVTTADIEAEDRYSKGQVQP